MKQRVLSLFLALTLCLTLLPTAAFAAEADFTVTNAGGALNPTTGSGFNAQVYKITNDGVDIEVSGTTSESSIVVTGDRVTLRLNNASMILEERNGSPIEIAENKSVTIIFAGENKLTADAGGPGILVNQGATLTIATVYKGNIIKNLIMDCQSYTKYRPNETTGGIFVSWRRKEELPTGA